MKYVSIIIVLFLVFSACNTNRQEKQNKIPENIISSEQMNKILVDVHLAEAALKYKRAKGKKFKLYSNQYFEHVFKKHNISKKQFDESLEYYYQHEKQLDKIYVNVLNELKKIKEDADKKILVLEK